MAVADGFHLPYRSGCCDAVLCIAVLHHLSSAARRLRMLQELLRLLRPGATTIMYLLSEAGIVALAGPSCRIVDADPTGGGQCALYCKV